MKSVFCVLLFLSFGAVASDNSTERNERPATTQEIKRLCDAVNASLEEQAADMGLDTEKCLASTTATATLVSEGVTMIMSDLEFNDPNRSGFILTCTTFFDGTEILKDSTVCQY